MNPKQRIAVLMGGLSAEREVSLKTGGKVLGALDPERYESFVVDPRPRSVSTVWLDTLAREVVDVAFIALHGRFGEDGTIQGLLEMLGIRYTGSGVLSSALAINKIKSKQIYRHVGLPTPDFLILRAADKDAIERDVAGEQAGHPQDVGASASEQLPAFSLRRPLILGPDLGLDSFPLPAVVKPNREGSTIGITIVRDPEHMGPALELAFRHDSEVLVERFVAGMEITGSVLGNKHLQALPLVEIIPSSGFYDYEMKYTPGATEEIVPARICAEKTDRAQELAMQAHKALGCRGMSRTDMIVGEDDIWVLETNTIPGMTETSLLPRAAEAAGIPFPRLVEKLIELALE